MSTTSVTSVNNKRIFKNTIFLYIRMFIILVVGLYTSRVILKTLGEVDFGIYNVVGGIVTMLAFLSNTMASASQRFFAYEIGRNDFDKLKQTFSSSVFLFAIFSLLCLVIAETVGLWFVYNKLNIPAERHEAAMFVYQFSVLAFVASIIRIPYNALIIARERMDFYAKISIVEVILKLAIIYVLLIGNIDKLKLYSILTFGVVVSVTFGYFAYCRFQFKESKLIFKVQGATNYKKLLSFSGWSLFGSLANMLMDQGVNILINVFFGPVVNAARGIAYQVKGQIMSFVGGFQAATNPQIIKYYSSGKRDEMKTLLFRGSKMTYFLLLLISLPILLEMEQLLKIWLHTFPEWTVLFARLVIFIVVVDSMSGCIIPAVQATGKIQGLEVKIGLTKLFNLPITYMLFRLGFSPAYSMIVSIFLNFLCLFVRMRELKIHLGVGYLEYFSGVIFYDILVTITSVIIPIILFVSLNQGIVSLIIIIIASLACTLLSIFYVGLNREDRQKLISVVKAKIYK